MADAFDVQGARAAGYSDDDIIEHLQQSRKFDVQGALGSGYSKQEVIDHLSSMGAMDQPAVKAEPPGALSQIGTSVWNAVKGGAHTALAASPLGSLPIMGDGETPMGQLVKGAVGAQVEQGKKAVENFKKGDVVGGVTGTLGAAVPLVGPFINNTADKISRGRPWEAGTDVALSVIPGMLPERLALPAMLKNFNNPIEEAALQSVQGKVPMTVGQRTGNQMLQRVEQGMENIPGSSGKMQDFYRGQKDALATEAQNQATATGGGQTNPFGAGQAVQQRLQQRITRLKSQADNIYSQVRSEAAANQKTVQTGTTTSPIVGPNGQPIQTPVLQTFETPVPLGPVKAQLAPIYDDLMRAMPEARRANSPAFRALDDLMKSDATFMNAMDFDKSLSAIKSIVRDGNSPYLTSKSQGIAKQMVKAGETQLQQALATAGPQTVNKLQAGRGLVKKYYDTAELLGDLADEPGALYSNLTTGGDRVFNTLTELNKVAPNEMRTVGRTYLQGLIDKATAEGGFQRADGIMRDWQRLGPETKKLLFGKQAADIDNFMLAAKRLSKDSNPSGTAKMGAALGSLGVIGESLAALVMGHPAVAAAGPAAMGSSRLLAQVLTNPGAATKLTNMMSMPVRTPAMTLTLGALTPPPMPPPPAQ